MQPRIIVIDGKTYHSVDEMPPDIRRRYELATRLLRDMNEDDHLDVPGVTNVSADANRNGIPDMLENIVAANAVVDGMEIIVDGRKFNGIDDLPPEARARYEEAMRKLDRNRNGIPDFVEPKLKHANQITNISTGFGEEATPRSSPFDDAPAARTSQDQPLPVSPDIAPDTSNGWALALIGIFLFALCAASAAGIWYFFLR